MTLVFIIRAKWCKHTFTHITRKEVQGWFAYEEVSASLSPFPYFLTDMTEKTEQCSDRMSNEMNEEEISLCSVIVRLTYIRDEH